MISEGEGLTTLKTFIKRNSVLTYFALVFAISWGNILIVIGGGGIPGTPEQTARLFPIALVTMLAGPTVAGILLTALVDGRAGFGELLSRLLKWRVGGWWYTVALLTTPLLVTPILFAFSRTSSLYLPGIVTTDDKPALLLSGITVGLAAGIFEELGWTGFAIPKLRLRYGMLTTGLIVGFLWGAWHFLVTFWASGDSSGRLSLELLLPPLLFYVAVLPAYRVLMVWVYDHTESLLVAMLMHASLTASTVFILMPPAIGELLMNYYFVLAAVLWVAVAAAALNQKQGKLGGRPPKAQLPRHGQTPANLHPSG